MEFGINTSKKYERNEIIWVFGTSASGKDTFIKRIVSSQNLAKKFNWVCEEISYSPDSLNFTGSDNDQQVIDARKNIIKDVLTLQKDFNVVLVKWQYIDTLLDTPQTLLHLLPESDHKIILLEAPLDELVARLKNKMWWNESWNAEEFAKSEKKMVHESIDKLKSDFKIIKINSASEDYNFMTK